MEQVTKLYEPIGNKRFRWKQKEFVLSTFTCAAVNMEQSIQNWKEVGVNHVELGWVSHERVWEAVELCEKYQLNLIFQDLSLLGGMMGRHMSRLVSDETIRDVAAKLKDKKYTVGYFIWDEPFQEDMFAEARRQSDILHECDPDALLYSVFVPSYNPGPTWDNGEYAQAFEEYIHRLDPPVLSIDHYPIGDYWGIYPGYIYDDEKQLDDAVIWCDLGLARKLARKHDLPFWFYYQACPLYKITKKFEHSMIRMMMYAAAIYGAKGLQMYAASAGEEYGRVTGDQIITAEGEKGIFFEKQKEVHAEFRNLGPTLMALESKLVYHSADLKPYGQYAEHYVGLADDITDSAVLSGSLPKRISVGELCDQDGEQYLFILNRDFYEATDVKLNLKTPMNVYEVSKKDGKQYLLKENTETISLHLENGSAVLLRVQPGEEKPYLINYQVGQT